MDIPLGVVVKGIVTGLDIKYEYNDQSLMHMQVSKFDTNILKRTISKSSGIILNKKEALSSAVSNIVDNNVDNFEFRNIKVNKPVHFSFIIKNCSGIKTKYYIFTKNYETLNIVNTENDFRTTVNNTTISKLRTKKLNEKIPHQMLSDKHEKVYFTSLKGIEYNKSKQIEKDSLVYLNNKKGIAIVIDNKEGKLEPHSQVKINVTIFNENIGDFEDEIVCEVKGLAPKIIPLIMNIRGNPLQLAPFQPGINYDIEPATLNIGYVLTKVNTIEKVFKLINSGSNNLSVNWKIYDYKDIVYPKRNIFNIKIGEKKKKIGSTFNLVYLPVEPKEISEDIKFNMTPKNVFIGPKATKDFKIEFHTDKPGITSALFVGYPKFEGAYEEVKLTELALKVDAFGVTPDLMVDKNVRFKKF